MGVARVAITCLPSLSSPWQRFTCSVFTVGALKLNKRLSDKFRKFLKTCESRRRVAKGMACIFRNILLSIRTGTYDSFVTVSVFVYAIDSG